MKIYKATQTMRNCEALVASFIDWLDTQSVDEVTTNRAKILKNNIEHRLRIIRQLYNDIEKIYEKLYENILIKK
jgi:hypothetical protein